MTEDFKVPAGEINNRRKRIQKTLQGAEWRTLYARGRRPPLDDNKIYSKSHERVLNKKYY